MKSIYVTLLAAFALCACTAGPELSESPTGERIAQMAEAWPVPDGDSGGVANWVPDDERERALALSPVLVQRAETYPSYIAQLELCARDGAWVLDDFLQRLDTQNIQGADRERLLRILATGRSFHEGFFRAQARNGFLSENWCDSNTPEGFRATMENDSIFGDDGAQADVVEDYTETPSN